MTHMYIDIQIGASSFSFCVNKKLFLTTSQEKGKLVATPELLATISTSDETGCQGFWIKQF